WQLEHVVAMVVARGGFDELALLVCEVVHGHAAAERPRLGNDGARNLAFVEGIAAAVLQEPEGASEIGIAVDLPGDRALAVDVPGLDGVGIELRAASL